MADDPKRPVGLKLRATMQERVKAHAASKGISQAQAYEELLSAALDGREVVISLPAVPEVPVIRVQEELVPIRIGAGLVAATDLPVGFARKIGSFQKGER